jgi:ferredoxin
MSLLSAAERLAAIDHSEVLLIAERCLHAQAKSSECAECYEICPVGAISPGKPPTLAASSCESCLACLPKCPTGAFNADDDVARLLKAVVHVEGTTVELLCGHNPQPELGVEAETPGIFVRHCLAGLGAGGLVALAAFGFERIVVRGDGCGACQWAPLGAEVIEQVGQANQFLGAWAKQDVITFMPALEEPVERPLWSADSPPVSRRELFRFMAHQGQVVMARAIEMNRQVGERLPGRNRMRLLGAADHLSEPQESAGADLAGLGFAKLSVSEACSACGTCARACPTSALSFEQDAEDMSYRLEIEPGLCIGCEICVHVCLPEAIEVQSAPSFEEIFLPESRTLREGKLAHCSRCSAPIAERPVTKLCPICEFRVQNPFGSMLPPDVEKARERESRKRPL